MRPISGASLFSNGQLLCWPAAALAIVVFTIVAPAITLYACAPLPDDTNATDGPTDSDCGDELVGSGAQYTASPRAGTSDVDLFTGSATWRRWDQDVRGSDGDKFQQWTRFSSSLTRSDGFERQGYDGLRTRIGADRPSLRRSGNDINVLTSATRRRLFTSSGSNQWTAPKDYDAELTFDDNNTTSDSTDDTLTIEEPERDRVYVLRGPDASSGNGNDRGRLIEVKRRPADDGDVFAYTTDGTVNQVTTQQGWNVAYHYYSSGPDSGRTQEVLAYDGSSNVISKSEYKYYDNVDSNSTKTYLGTTGDLVSVKTSKKTSGSSWITATTLYRYYNASSSDGRLHQPKIVFEPDAVERIINYDPNDGISTPDDIMEVEDSGTNGKVGGSSGGPAAKDLKDFATRSYTYYTANSATSSINTPWATGEELESKYGGSNVSEYNTGATNPYGKVKTMTTSGSCASCGGSVGGGRKHSYFYMALNGGTSTDPDDVVKIVVIDTEDSSGTAQYRTIYGLNAHGAQLREVVIENPVGTSTRITWCRSIMLNDDLRVIERRMPSAHTLVDSDAEIKNFLDPTTSDNDADTLNGSSGVIYVYAYDFSGTTTYDTKVKQGSSGTAYYISAISYGDGDGDATGKDASQKTLVTETRTYPQPTTTRGDGKRTTYSYTFWDTDDTAIKTKTTTLPSIASGQNGSGTATTTTEYYDMLGRLRWTKDGEGYVNYYSYQPDTGGQAYVAVDVDPSSMPSSATGNDDDWVSANDDGDGNATYDTSGKPTRGSGLPTALALITKTYFDAQARVVKVIDPRGNTTYTLYESDKTIQFPFIDGTGKPALPAQVTKLDDAGQVLETYGIKPSAVTTASGLPTGISDSQGNYTSWTRNFHDTVSGRLVKVLKYHDIPSSGDGTHLTNYYVTAYDYDTLGRRTTTVQTVQDDAGFQDQITQSIYDVLDRATEVKRDAGNSGVDTGANATLGTLSFSGLTTVSKTEYDSGDVGDGHVTSTKNYYDTGTSDYIQTNMHRTFRGFLRAEERKNGSTAVKPHTIQDVAWQGRTIDQAQYTTTITDFSTVVGDDDYVATHSSGRNDWTKTHYDDLGRVYKIDRYPGIMTSSHFQTDSYYDRNGRLVGTGDLYSAQREMAYDGAGRRYQTRTVCQLNSSHYSSAKFQYRNPDPNPSLSSMSGGDDKVIEVAHTVYDSGGNVTETHSFEVNHDDTDGMDLSSDDDYIRRSVYSWYDTAGRLTYQADYGTGNATSSPSTWKYVAPASRPASHLDWTSSQVYDGYVLLTAFGYNSDTGRQETVANGVSKNGSNTTTVTTKTFFDDLGRRTATAENYVNYNVSADSGAGGGTNNDEDRVTKWEYNGLGQISKLTAVNMAGSTELDQETDYQYSDTHNATLVTLIKYPDVVSDSDDNEAQMTYDLDGSLVTRTDQRGVVITYSYNDRRQVEAQGATTIPSGVDTTVKSIKWVYDTLGRVATVTSYADDDATGTVRNQIKHNYKNYNRLYRLYQSQAGVVDANTPYVEWVYDTSVASGVYSDGLRVFKVLYPVVSSAQVVYYFGSADSRNDRFNRLRYHKLFGGNLNGNLNHTVYYEYNGAARVAEVLSSGDNVRRRMFSSSGNYDSWDRFGRTVTQAWKRTSGTLLDQVDHTYDYAGSRLSRDVPSSLYSTNDQDQSYQYDGLQRLKHIDEGTWSGSAITSKKFAQDWTLDPLGNWPTFKEDANGNGSYTETSDLDQDRKHNKVNEIDNDEDHSTSPVSTITAGAGQANWVDPVYDAAGNTTTIPQPSSPTSSYTLKYDAWNRLVEVKSGSTVIASYEYDGLNRRIQKVVGSDTYDYYYNDKWQVLTVVKNSTAQAVYSWHPFYVDAVAVRMRASDQHFFFQDANFNVTAAVDSSSNNVVERYRYTPYGVVQVMDASFGNRSSSTIANPYTYTGRRLDDETGLFYYRNRYYHAQLGRFVSRDPIGCEGGINLYEYVGNTPTNATDASGLWRFVPGMGTLSGSFGPGDERNYGKASSQFQLSFHPDWRAFAANKKGTCCAQIKFVQIFYADVTAITTSLPNRKWTLDPYRYRGTRPYYPDGIFLNPSKEGIGSSTFDGPYFGTLWRYARPSSISMDFETCAVCSESKSPGGKKGIGDVFACVRWGHSFQIAGSILNAHVRGWKRYVESDIWTDSVFVLGGPPDIFKNNPNHQFKDVAKVPSHNMKPLLKKYFP